MRFYGIAGVAIGTLIPAVLSQLLVQGPYCVRLLEANGRDYVLGIVRAAVPVIAAMWLSNELAGLLFDADNWPRLIARIVLVGLPITLFTLAIAWWGMRNGHFKEINERKE